MELAPRLWQAGGMKTPSAIDSFAEIATARIELMDTDPPIWREVELPTSITLKVLHDIVQATIGWMDYHLWEFVIDGRRYGLHMDEDWSTAPRKGHSRGRTRRRLSPLRCGRVQRPARGLRRRAGLLRRARRSHRSRASGT